MVQSGHIVNVNRRVYAMPSASGTLALPWGKIIVWYALLLCVANLFILFEMSPWAINPFAWKIDPGFATLIGTLIGLSVFGYQARVGFGNLVASQENQANIERKRQEEELKKERYLLASALRAEIMALTWEVTKSVQWATTMAFLLRDARGQWTGGVKIPSRALKTPVFDANVSKLGLLGASVAGDVIAVLAKARADTSINDPKDVLDNKVVANYYEGLSKSFEAMYEEMMHISRRLECFENSKIEDPGSVGQIYVRRLPGEVGIETPTEWQQYRQSRQTSIQQEP
jgi:hypothetical protein